RKRLGSGRTWRRQLEKWSAPGQELAKNLRRKTKSTDAVRLVLGALGPFGLDYSSFTLDDLEAPQAPEPSIVRPLIVTGPTAFLKAGDYATGIGSPRLVAWYLSEGGELGLRLAGDFEHTDRGEIRWSDGTLTEVKIEAQHRLATAVIEGAGWLFGTLV